jgi:alpha-glucuronidase
MMVLLALALAVPAAAAEDGSRLWLRYDLVEHAARDQYRASACQLVIGGESSLMQSARAELQRGLQGLLGRTLPESRAVTCEGSIVLLRTSSPLVRTLDLPRVALGADGFMMRSVRMNGHSALLVAAQTDRGLLYGAFALVRRIQLRQPLRGVDLIDQPTLALRMLNHWDNLDRHVERGYAGQSLWDWHKLPLWRDPRITDYARANASVGINAAVLNNVNSNADILTKPWLLKVGAIAEQLRPWGMRVFLSARFSAPMELGGLETADPLDPQVRKWWKGKASEIYSIVPDFGGFLVKANSEGQPGPQDFGRTHAEGANMLAEALRPYGGTVLWRAFVYAPTATDRTRQGYDEFHPLDGKFAANVIVQIKNGPLDFQPREPFHPLFGAMDRTNLALELQLTKEYLGFATHLAYLGPMWEEVLQSRTFLPKADSRVRLTIKAMAGVANVGIDRNWTGSHFDQANWYAFGRLAWNPAAPTDGVAEEWSRMTWSSDPQVSGTITSIMMRSHQAVVDYMTPMGLAHLMGSDHHYGPAPWVNDLDRPDWNPVYYHRADSSGIGFDRTKSGSNALSQYAEPVRRSFSLPATTPEALLLWFHRLSWDYRTPTGRSLWEELLGRYDRGLRTVSQLSRSWQGLRATVDQERHDQVASFLSIQEREARWWRDASIAYWLSVANRPLPKGVAPPEHSLQYYRSLRFPHAPGQAGR